MAGLNDEKMRIMEDEMNRFEAEIALPVLPPPPPPPVTVNTVPPRAVIGSNTYHQVQRRLEEQQTISNMTEYQNGPAMGFHPMMTPANTFTAIPPPPPPPPPPLLVPHQVQRNPPLRHPIGPPGPIMGGPPPPPPPAFMGHIPPHPNAAFMGPPGPPMMDMGPSVAQPMPSMQSPMPAIVSATPLIYSPKSLEKSETSLAIEDSPEETILQKRKKFKMGLTDKLSEISRAKEMSDRVKVSTIVSTLGSNSDDHSGSGRKKEKKSKKHIRMAGGQVWEDSSLQEWEDDDFRIFCGDLGNDVTDEILTRAFSKYQSFLKAKVVRDKRSNKTKGFGFVSFKDPQDFIKAMKEMNGRYVGSRPIKLRKSTWKARNIDTVRKKEREKTTLIGILTGR